MAIIRYADPFRQMQELLDGDFDRWFSDPFGLNDRQLALTAPATDVYAEGEGKNQKLIAEFHLPNFNKDDIRIDLDDGALSIKAEHQEKDEKKGRRYMLRESATSFYRRIGLPKNVDASNVQANFRDGVLKVSIPYKELPKPKNINISGK